MKPWSYPSALLTVVFVLTRLSALEVLQHDSDICFYAGYAAEWHAASARGQSFYDFHRQGVETQIEHSTPIQAAALREYTSVEYPPLAVSFMAIPALLVDDPFAGQLPNGFPVRYARAFIAMMALFDVAVLLLVVYLVHRLYPADTPWEKCERCLVYVVATWPLYGILYARLDLGVALSIVLALALLVSRRGWWLSFFVLALGIHFKLMPVVLAPLWVFAALPMTLLQAPWRDWARDLAVRGSVLAGYGIVILALFWWWQGPGIVGFLGYHKERGLAIESTWSSLLLLVQPLGIGWDVYHSHGCVNVRSPITPLLVGMAGPTMVVLLLGFTALFVAAARRQKTSSTGTIAQAQPRLVAGFALLLLVASIVANKVFSPQYLLWVLPLIPLLDFRRPVRRLYFAVALTASFLTMRIFPDCFLGDIVYVAGMDGELPIFGGPTLYGASLLLARNGLFMGLMVALAASKAHAKFDPPEVVLPGVPGN